MKADHHHPTAASLLPLCVLRLFCVLAAVAAELPSTATEPPVSAAEPLVAAHGQLWGAANGRQWGAVGWPVRWISHPCAAAGERVWFRRSFTGEGRAVAGQIEMAVSRAAVVYVNGYNVTADAIPLPFMKSSSSISSITHAAGLSPLGESEGAGALYELTFCPSSVTSLYPRSRRSRTSRSMLSTSRLRSRPRVYGTMQ